MIKGRGHFVSFYALCLVTLFSTYFFLNSNKSCPPNGTAVPSIRSQRCSIIVGLFSSYITTKQQRNFHRALIDTFNSTTRNKDECSEQKTILVQFVVGLSPNFKDDEQFIEESKEHKDIVILPCAENMNQGKTYTWFAYVQTQLFDLQPKLAFKLDADTFLHYDNFAADLNKYIQNQSTIYYGRISQNFMTGMLYGFSLDVISAFTRNKTVMTTISGGEDWQSARWVDGIKALSVQRINNVNTFTDHPDHNGGWNKPFRNDLIAIHQIKTTTRWNSTIHYFFQDEDQKKLEKLLILFNKTL